MSLFQVDAPWRQAAKQVHVFKFYQEWIGSNATDVQLRQAVTDLNRRGIAIGLEGGPLNATTCGQEVEGFSGVANALFALRRIAAAGGTVRVIAMDEPFFYASIYSGRNACRWPVEKTAAEVHQFIQAARSVFPNVIVGDTEPMTNESRAPEFERWLDTFRQVNGYDLPFLHLDMSYDMPDWVAQVRRLQDYGRRTGIKIGIIYMGEWDDQTDEAWLARAGERIKRYELDAGGRPDHVLFQSWNDHPDRVLPETEPYTWTGLIRLYASDKKKLGLRVEGAGANLSYRKPVQASNSLPDQPPQQAVDGEPSQWGSGSGPPQWIQVDLLQPSAIKLIRLTVAQYPDGPTVHRVWGGSPAAQFTLLHEFNGLTKDNQVLEFVSPRPLTGIRYIKVETVSSPSWVSWKEIEIIAP